MKTHAVLYTKPNCPACKMTTKWFDRLGYPYQNTYYGNADKSNTIDVRTCLVSFKNYLQEGQYNHLKIAVKGAFTVFPKSPTFV